MPRQRRKKPEAAASKARPASPRSTRPRRRGRAAGAGEPEAEADQPAPRRPVSGGSLPGSARPHSPRRSRKPRAQNGVRVEVLTQSFLRRRFQGLGCLLEQLRDKVHLLRRRQLSVRTTVGLGIFVGVMHWIHLSILFENDRHFSHLSSLEREMTFRTEMGLYYSYFKTIIQAPSFLEGLWTIMNDRLTEYPLVINTVKRFHLYPEVILAFWYRTFVGITNVFGIETKTCWNVTRVQPLSEVQSCEGVGDPACFYVGVIFILNGVMMSMFFIYGACLSGTHFGGLITVLCYFFNHGEATRVMWTPPLRESFSYPFLVLQMCILTLILRLSHSSGRYYIALCLSNVAFMLPWQFAQFILFTQIASLFPMYVVGYIEPNKFKKIIYMNMISVLLCFVLMFGNSLYLSSYYSSSLLMTWVIILKRNNIQRLGVSELNFWLIQCFGWFCGTIILKFLTSKILGVSDHIRLSDLIAARILRFTDFDTLIYTCAPEFGFMEKATPVRYIRTLLLPLVMMITYFILKKLIFHTLQLLAFTALAILIMRLKLFLTPHMCVMASLICSRRLFGWLFYRVRFENVIFGLLTVMSIQGFVNLRGQWSILGEFNNLPQEELIEWISSSTRADAVFAGAMPTMASVKLSTLRPIVNHPHYEDADLRARTKIVYGVYSRKSAKEVRDKLLQLHVNYYILEEAWCVVRTKPGCSMLEIWDLEDPSNAANPPLCSTLLQDARPYFTVVFQNSMYRVLKVA
ncbi:probable C-mannosyltransferase DPY19L2 isoform X2 [Myotis myotis]|uniref:probable C-mannosyltransferase DPY19L2 isoform X2 n=1 Tax=Myotis myotis TaxID=51298 RepID=UPI00174E0482|nr:probable C-mannosyltransferase DPY19L2 isoform X2 [Myotis myotis]